MTQPFRYRPSRRGLVAPYTLPGKLFRLVEKRRVACVASRGGFAVCAVGEGLDEGYGVERDEHGCWC